LLTPARIANNQSKRKPGQVRVQIPQSVRGRGARAPRLASRDAARLHPNAGDRDGAHLLAGAADREAVRADPSARRQAAARRRGVREHRRECGRGDSGGVPQVRHGEQRRAGALPLRRLLGEHQEHDESREARRELEQVGGDAGRRFGLAGEGVLAFCGSMFGKFFVYC